MSNPFEPQEITGWGSYFAPLLGSKVSWFETPAGNPICVERWWVLVWLVGWFGLLICFWLVSLLLSLLVSCFVDSVVCFGYPIPKLEEFLSSRWNAAGWSTPKHPNPSMMHVARPGYWSGNLQRWWATTSHWFWRGIWIVSGQDRFEHWVMDDEISYFFVVCVVERITD